MITAARGRAISVYVVGEVATGPVKIGVSQKVSARVRSLEWTSKQALRTFLSMPRPDGDALLVERFAHEALSDRRANGEWFDVTADEAIAAVHAAVARVESDEVSLTGQAREPVMPVGRTLRLFKREWDEIEEYRKQVGAATIADAVRRLVVDALRAAKRRRP